MGQGAAEAAALLKEAANQRALLPLKMELDLQAKLAKARADAQFRTTNKVDIASLQALNREQMVNLETTKAIDKLYRDHAKAAATLSKEYQEARAQLAPLTQAQQVHLQQIKLLDEWNTKLAKAMAMQSAPVQAAIKQYNDLTNKVERATKASKVFSESMSGTNQITAGFRAALAGVGMGFGIYTSGTILAASATYTVVAAFRDVIASGAEFEKEMARVTDVGTKGTYRRVWGVCVFGLVGGGQGKNCARSFPSGMAHCCNTFLLAVAAPPPLPLSLVSALVLCSTH